MNSIITESKGNKSNKIFIQFSEYKKLACGNHQNEKSAHLFRSEWMHSDNVIMLCAALYEFEWISITYDNEEQKWITYTLYIYCTWDYIVYVSLVNQIMLLKMGGAQMHC